MKIHKIIALVFVSTFLFSCNFFTDSSPNRVFELIGLNANKIPSSYERVFKEYYQQKQNGTLQALADDQKSMRSSTCVEAVNFFYGNTFKEDIKKIHNLSKTDETKPIIEAAIDMFEYAQEIQTNDFPKIAKMIDDGKTQEEVNQAAQQLDNTKGAEVDKKYKKVMELLLPYADKHGVEYKKF
ncbi:hypothetical protein [Flavobacterium gelatinilyticum]|uniref:hypothetical protein n=1 Tax=Flavobacterium gelatinilyticum TaxID=3003260 RepID=UPI002481678B|nr:hypothetical protein [Flavobacterium gelatinilyticum]